MKVEIYHRRHSDSYSMLFGYVKVPQILIDVMCRKIQNPPYLVELKHLDESLKEIIGKPTDIVALIPTFPLILSQKRPGKKRILSALKGVTFCHTSTYHLGYPNDFILKEREVLCSEMKFDIKRLIKEEAWNYIGKRPIDRVYLFLFLYYIEKKALYMEKKK